MKVLLLAATFITIITYGYITFERTSYRINNGTVTKNSANLDSKKIKSLERAKVDRKEKLVKNKEKRDQDKIKKQQEVDTGETHSYSYSSHTDR